MRKLAYFLALAVMLTLFSNNASAFVINVPADQPTIQLGLNAAQLGDTVLVQPNTYVENLFWPPVDSIKLLSAGDSSNTIIDGNNTSSVIHFFPGIAHFDTATVIRGFRITNGGNVTHGGGIYMT